MKNLKMTLLCLSLLTPLVVLFLNDPIAQNQAYHNFADKRLFFKTTNFFDVFSNIGFIIIGAFGVKDAIHYPRFKTSWVLFYIGVFLIGPGSAYYHLNTNNFTLIWDRLPMTLGFMGIFTAIISETFNLKHEKLILFILTILGIYSVIHWQIYGDLRLYFWIQAAPLLAILLIGIMYKSESIKGQYLVVAFVFYGLAKVTELLDSQIFLATRHLISGHSLKHLLAAVAIYFLYLMKRKTLKTSI